MAIKLEIFRERNWGLCSRLSNDRGVATCREAGLDPLNTAFSAPPREGTLRPVRPTRTRALPPFVRAAPKQFPASCELLLLIGLSVVFVPWFSQTFVTFRAV